MKKKWFAALLAAVMLVGLLPAALAEGESTQAEKTLTCKYATRDNNVVTVGGDVQTSVTVPAGKVQVVVFFLDGAASAPSSVVSSNEAIAKARYQEQNTAAGYEGARVYDIVGNAAGSATLTVMVDNVAYSMDVTVTAAEQEAPDPTPTPDPVPTLGVRYVRMSDQTENSNGPYTSIKTAYGSGVFVVFYLCTAGSDPVYLDDITKVMLDEREISATGTANDGLKHTYYQINTDEFGTHILTVTAGGKDYTMNVTVTVPPDGWFKDTADPSQDNFAMPLNNGIWTFTAGNDVVLYLRADQTITSCVVSEQFADQVNVELRADNNTIPENYAKVTFDGNAEWGSSNISFRVNDSFWADLHLNKVIPPRVVMLDGDGGLRDSLVLNVGSEKSVSFCVDDAVSQLLSGTVTSNNETVVAVTGADGVYTVTAQAVGDTSITFTHDGGSVTFPVLVREFPALYGIEVTGNAVTVGDYTVGFLSQITDDVYYINDGRWAHTVTSGAADIGEYSLSGTAQFGAGIRKTDSQGAVYYEFDKNAPVEWTVKRAWIEPVDGDEDIYSLSPDVTTHVKTYANGEEVKLYCRPGREFSGMLRVELEIGGEIKTVALCILSDIRNIVSFVRPDTDTVEDLNAYLKQLVANCEKDQHYTVYLGNTTYNGTIQLPEFYNRNYGIVLTLQGGENTIVNGSMDLNRSRTDLKNIHFVATGAENETGLYGGGGLVRGCTFAGYKDTAVEVTTHTVRLEKCFFYDNAVAVDLDFADQMYHVDQASWENNTFVGNDVAVRLQKLSQAVSAYNFRIYDCDFINNGYDFDVRCKDPVYYYRNFFGSFKGGGSNGQGKASVTREQLADLRNAAMNGSVNEVLTDRAPKLAKSGGTVVYKPRWKFPVLKYGLDIDHLVGAPAAAISDEPVSGSGVNNNILIVDWSNTESGTVILTEEADKLPLDPSNFEGGGEKTINVVTGANAIELGTWTFN